MIILLVAEVEVVEKCNVKIIMRSVVYVLVVLF